MAHCFPSTILLHYSRTEVILSTRARECVAQEVVARDRQQE